MMRNRSSHDVIAYIGIGANLGNPVAQVEAAIEQLGKIPATNLLAQSSLFSSAPIEADGADFINAVACIQTDLDAHALLHALQQIEQEFGRERLYYHAPRTIDLDLLLYGQSLIDDAQLTVPHPAITQRAFVLMPLLQINPFIIIPNYGQAQKYIEQVAGQRIHQI